MTERITEEIVRSQLKAHGHQKIEEQQSCIAKVQNLLKDASKSGSGIGKPEFLVTHTDWTDYLLVIECKKDTRHHSYKESASSSVFQGIDPPPHVRELYAVEGVLHYMTKLAVGYNVIGVAASGTDDLRISTFFQLKGSSTPQPLLTRGGKPIESILSWHDYLHHATFDPRIKFLRQQELDSFARDLHNFMRDHAKLTESEKPLLVSGTLLALNNPSFCRGYDLFAIDELADQWVRAAERELNSCGIIETTRTMMVHQYTGVVRRQELNKGNSQYPKGILHEMIRRLHEKVWPFISDERNFDVDTIGKFYGEFLKYTGGDKQGLGIVLTPKHIAELLASLANVKRTTRMCDICAGTGGFLIASLHAMFADAETAADRDAIMAHGVLGIEQQHHMFSLAAANLRLRDERLAGSLQLGDCFDPEIGHLVQARQCNVMMLNPPYSQKDQNQRELKFIKRACDLLTVGGMCFAIVPVGCTDKHFHERQELLKYHTLDAVMTLPNGLFHGVGTVPCLMVFRAHIPHDESGLMTWFGHWKDDGFFVAPHRGRIDSGRWSSIKDRWVEAYRNKLEVPGLSVKQRVGPRDEWCAEAYMQTDYSKLTTEAINKSMCKFAAFKIEQSLMALTQQHAHIDTDAWVDFTLEELFTIKKGKRLIRADTEPGTTPFIGAIDNNNGVACYISAPPNHTGNTITVAYNGSVGEAFYQPVDYFASDDINVLYPKFEMTEARAMFVCAMIRQEQYRFSYGRKWHLSRMKTATIRLPVSMDGTPDWSWIDRCVQELNSCRQPHTTENPEQMAEFYSELSDCTV